MVKRWSMALIGKVFVIRDTIEQSVFYIALAVIMLCAVLFLAVPSLTRANSSSAGHKDLTVTLAGAGTESSDENTGADSAVRWPAYMDILAGCREKLEKAIEDVNAAVPEHSLSRDPLNAASIIGYTAVNTVEDNRLISYTDYQTLLQIVEAECTGGDERSKQYVACVVLNRTRDDHFPDTVYDVVWQRLSGKAQFSPTQDGRMGTLKISDSTVAAVNKALQGEDISEGALFFLAREYAAKDNVKWFEDKLEYLYSYGGHEYYRFKEE